MGAYAAVSTAGMPREQWLEERRKGIGGSDAAALVGMNEWATPWTVYADKIGATPDRPETEPIRIGHDLEEYVAKRFTEASGMPVRRANAIYKNDKYPYSLANIDRKIVNNGRCGLECKTTSAFNVKRYRDGAFPDRFYCQCVHYMGIMEYDRWYLAVLVLGEALHIYMMTRLEGDILPDWCEAMVYVPQEEIDALMGAETAFWERHVMVKRPPDLDGEKPTTGAVELVAGNGEYEVDLNLAGAEGALRNYLQLDQQVKLLEKEREKWKQTILVGLGGAQKGHCGKIKVENKPASRSTFDFKSYSAKNPGVDFTPFMKVSSYTRFTVKEGK